jgi:hypothetical protein
MPSRADVLPGTLDSWDRLSGAIATARAVEPGQV